MAASPIGVQDLATNCTNLLDLVNYKNEDDPAVIWKDPKSETVITVTYKDVFAVSEKLSQMLSENKVCSNFIGVEMETSISFPSVILGVLKYGAAFVCLDLHKEDWKKNICDKLSIQWKFTTIVPDNSKEHTVASIKCWGDTIFLVESRSNSEPSKSNVSHSNKNKIAYACQTSGTTGIPKIVQVPHSSIIPNIIHLRSLFKLGSGDIVMQSAPPTFDPSVVELFLALSSGVAILEIPQSTKRSPALLSQILNSNPKPTVIQATPSLVTSLGLRYIQTSLLGTNSALRVLALGGEPCPNLSVLASWKSVGNQTTVFNLYGVTEVSCWSTCHEIKFPLTTEQTDDCVCLGEPFPYTTLQVRDSLGNIITEGEGELFITNGDRMCVVEGQILNENGTKWCATGDLVRITADGTLFFIGRKADSRTVKRWGQKISLDLIESAALKCDIIQTCHAVTNINKSLPLTLFVILQEPASLSAIEIIKQHLRKTLPSTMQPEAIINIPQLPLTHHGKMDKQQLKVFAEDWVTLQKYKSTVDLNKVKEVVRSAWSDTLQWSGGEVEEKASFLGSGGDSAQAAMMAAELLLWAGKSDDETLLTTILNASFVDIYHKLYELIKRSPGSLNETYDPVANKRPRLSDPDFTVNIATNSSHVWKPAVSNPDHPSLIMSLSKGNMLNCQGQYHTWNNETLSMEQLWRCDMFKCVDASPLILQYNNGICVTIIGSHSGKVIGVDVDSGVEKWSLNFGDRIEASAIVSSCGQFVCLGCYDGRLYCIEVLSGTCCWAFQTGAIIKGSPLFYESKIICGSYDECIYCLDLMEGKLLWQQNLKAGPVLASPLMSSESVIIATLRGTAASLNIHTGTTEWTVPGSTPYFASPVRINKQSAIFGEVCGLITSRNTVDGTKQWSYKTQGELFSSFTVLNRVKDSCHIMFGCSDNQVYCLNDTGQLVWKCQLNGRVTSTPYLCQLSSTQNKLNTHLVAVVSAPKQLTIIDAHSGHLVNVLELPHETFSSPVIYKNLLIIGSRDNYLHCFQLCQS